MLADRRGLLATGAESVARFVSRMARGPAQAGLPHLKSAPLSMVQRSAAAQSPGTVPEGEAQEERTGARTEDAESIPLADAVAAKYVPGEVRSGFVSREPVSLVQRETGDERGAGAEGGLAGVAEKLRSAVQRSTARPQRPGGTFDSRRMPFGAMASEAARDAGPTPYYGGASSSRRTDDPESIMRKSHEDSSAGTVHRKADRKGSVFEGGGAMADGLDLVLAKMDQDWDDGASPEHVMLKADGPPATGADFPVVEAETEEVAGEDELDLDELARQVYPVLKRMLAIERERMGCA
jgi:hypothetical protein